MKFIKGILLLISFFSAGCTYFGEQFPQTGKFLADTIPGLSNETAFPVAEGNPLFVTSYDEYTIGRGVAAVILGKFRPLPEQQKQRYLSQIGQVLARFSDRPEVYGGYRFVIIESEQINAMAAPGGIIFITTGLLDVLPNEEALAAVLAHEISHVVNRHGIESIAAGKTAGTAIEGGAIVAALDCSGASQLITGAFATIVGEVVDTLLEKGYSREQEFEADEEAAELLTRAGYNPQGINEVLSLLKQFQNTKGGWFDTHPSPQDRLEALNLESAGPVPGQSDRLVRFQQVIN